MLDTKPQIAMWVLLSRRGQIKMHERYPVKGLAACLRREFPEVGSRYVKDYIVPVEFAIMEAGGDIDYTRVNVHLCEKLPNGFFKDMGIFDNLDVAGEQAGIKAMFFAGRLEVVLTMEDVREANGRLLTM